MTRWTEFIKDFAKRNNVSYGCAMSDPKLREEYYKKYPIKTKEQKLEDQEKSIKNTSKLSVTNFKNKYVKPHLDNPNDPILKDAMVNKYRKFSQRLKDFIKEKAPKIYTVVNNLAEAKDKRKDQKLEQQRPKETKAKAKNSKPVKKEERELTEIEKIRIRLEKISNIKGGLMNPNQKKELKKLLDERERLREKMNNLLKKKLKETKKKEPKKKVESKLKKYRYSFDISSKEVQDNNMEREDLVKKNKELLSNVYIARVGWRGEKLVRDMNFLRYLVVRGSSSGGYTPKEAKQASSHFLSQTKNILKQLKNVKVGGGEENDKIFKVGELKVLVPVKK